MRPQRPTEAAEQWFMSGEVQKPGSLEGVPGPCTKLREATCLNASRHSLSEKVSLHRTALRANPRARKIHEGVEMMVNTVPEVFLPGKSHGHRSLVDCSLRGHKESDTTEATENPHTVPDEVPRVSRGWGLTPLQSASSGQ